VGERVTVVASPSSGAKLRKGGPLSSRPPNTRPGQPLSLVSHATGASTRLLRPPTDAPGLPSWLAPVLITIALGDAGSALVDPALPLLLAAGAAGAAATLAGGGAFLVPRWKQLPANAVRGRRGGGIAARPPAHSR